MTNILEVKARARALQYELRGVRSPSLEQWLQIWALMQFVIDMPTVAVGEEIN